MPAIFPPDAADQPLYQRDTAAGPARQIRNRRTARRRRRFQRQAGGASGGRDRMERRDVYNRLFGRLDTQRSTSYVLRLAFVSMGGIFLDGYDIVIIGLGLAGIKSVFHPTPFDLVLIGVIALFGVMIGSLMSGYVTDRVGRKVMFILDLILLVAAALLSGLSQNIYELVIFRFLVGVGVGIDFPVATSYVSELVPARSRGRYMTLLINFFNVGALVAVIVAYKLYPLGIDVAWRYMLALSAAPALLILFMRLGIEESPRWLFERGYIDEAIKVVEKATGLAISAEDKDQLRRSRVPERGSGSYVELLTKYTRDAVFIGILYMLFQIVFISTGVLEPLFAKSLGVAGETTALLYWSFAIVGVVIISILVETPLGRRNTGLIGFGGTTALIAALTFIPHSYSLVIVSAYILLSLVTNLAATLHFLYSPELFPTRIRATAEGWKQGIGRAAGIAVALLSPFVSFDTLLYIILGFSVLAFLNQFLLARETRGKTLEEISG
ncbi:MAG: MFS transporter [Rhodospirillales bacterium]|nr:MFS transporter [Rhodospirillales bacterium]